MTELYENSIKGIKETICRIGEAWKKLKELNNEDLKIFKEDWGMDRIKERTLTYAKNHITIAIAFLDELIMDIKKKKESQKAMLNLYKEYEERNIKIIRDYQICPNCDIDNCYLANNLLICPTCGYVKQKGFIVRQGDKKK
jgi:ribosomal protein S27AE